MGKVSRKRNQNRSVESCVDERGSSFNKGEETPLKPAEGVCSEVVRRGIKDLGGTVRLALGAVEDMLAGTLTVGEATVVNTSIGRVLKAVELEMKHRSNNRNANQLRLPGRSDESD